MGTHFNGSEEEVNTLNAYIKLVRATESINSIQSKSLAKENLTISQFGTLETLHHLGPQNQREIGKKLLKSGGNITLVIDNLTKRDLVQRKTDEKDRRAIIVSLTSKGKKFIESYFPKHLALIIEQFSVLSDEDKADLARICKKLGLNNS
tara:strand:+ start:9382 stop:9831 length:450 start_codon:yes stop_codon:yes gene_type:complete